MVYKVDDFNRKNQEVKYQLNKLLSTFINLGGNLFFLFKNKY